MNLGYRNNLDIWSKIKFRARMLTDVSGVNKTLPYAKLTFLISKLCADIISTTFLGYNFSAPIFIAPAARAVYGDERAELNFVDAAANENILYTVSEKSCSG